MGTIQWCEYKVTVLHWDGVKERVWEWECIREYMVIGYIRSIHLCGYGTVK